MKRELILFMAFICPLFLFAQKTPKPAKPGTLKYLDEKRGLKSIILGADVISIQNDIELDADSVDDQGDGIIYYNVINPELMSIGEDIHFKTIIVGVFDGRIARIAASMEKPNGRTLYETLKVAYGSGYKHNQFMDSYIWRSRYVLMKVDFEGFTEDTFLMADRDIQTEIEKYKKERSLQAISDL